MHTDAVPAADDLLWPQTTGQAISDYLGFTPQWLAKLEKQGFVERRDSRLFDAGAVCRGYIAWLKDESRRSSKTEIAKQRDAEQLKKLRIENAKALHQLIDMETIEASFAEIFTLLRATLGSVAAGCTRDVALRQKIDELHDHAFERARLQFEQLQEQLRCGVAGSPDDLLDIDDATGDEEAIEA